MLKISVLDDGDPTILKLEGKIAGPWAMELDQEWQALATSLGSRKLCLDLCGVTFVDEKGKQVLRDIFTATGAEILANSPLTKYFADEARQQMPDNNEEEI